MEFTFRLGKREHKHTAKVIIHESNGAEGARG